MLEYLTSRPFLHLALHFIIPLIIAPIFYREQWKKTYLILISTMLVDLDHLLADPIYAPNRCSIGFHPLHSAWAIGGYALAFLVKPLRIIALGLLIHMGLDGVDCQFILIAIS